MLGEMFLIAALLGEKVQAESQKRVLALQTNGMKESEDLRKIEDAWSRFWMEDQTTQAQESGPQTQAVRRMSEMMNESFNSGQIEELSWWSFWWNKQPCHLTPDRTDGSVR